MNLQSHLLKRITLVALCCLLVIVTYLLEKSHQQADQQSQQTADAVSKHLQSQLLLRLAGIGQTNAFPDFEFWKQSAHQPGVCLTFTPADARLPYSVCNGTKLVVADWPVSFELLYRWAFKPGSSVVQAISVQGREYGSLTVTPSAELEIDTAWNKVSSLLALSAVTILAVCLLVYLTISQALRPAKTIVEGLAELASGRLAYRLPLFKLNEWQNIAKAINQLAASQQQLLDERQMLLVKLIDLQEQERRLLARELHDEFGQCLAAINAVVTSIKQSAQIQSPDLVSDADQISGITLHMLAQMRGMLGRLRPAGLDELGLSISLNGLVADWNCRNGDKTRYGLNLIGECTQVTESRALTLFRIVQECLTNIAKHAAATHVYITLLIEQGSASLTVVDDGVADTLPFEASAGMGLLGIRERVCAVNGKLNFAIAEPHGLIVEVFLPAEPMI